MAFKKLIIFLALFTCKAHLLLSQVSGLKFEGQISDSSGIPVAAASAILHDNAGNIIGSGHADEGGAFSIISKPVATCILKITAVSFYDFWDTIHVQSTDTLIKLGSIVLHHKITTNQAVVVTATRNTIEVKADRTVLNVAGSINSTGSTAFELLQKMPGVRINNDEIMINGKNGLVVYQDGKNVNLSGKELISFLRSLPSSNMSAIEIITNPSARYDAAGNGGVIDIKLKRSEAVGLTGNAIIIAKYSTYNPKYDPALNLFYRSTKIYAFVNYSYSRGNYKSVNDYFRQQKDQNNIDVNYDQGYNNYLFAKSHNLKSGIDFFLTPKTRTGIMGNMNLSENNNLIRSETKIYQPDHPVDSTLFSNNNMPQKTNRFNYDGYISHAFENSQLNVDVSFGTFDLSSTSAQDNTYESVGGFLRSTDYFNNSSSKITSGAIKSDYQKKLHNASFAFGVKSSWVKSDNYLGFYNVIANVAIVDTGKTNHFVYKENINAAYIDYKTAGKKWSANAGLRIEHVKSSSLLMDLSDTLKGTRPNYINVFPSLSISRILNDNHSITLIYNRRIDRPNYRNFNPFLFVIDELSYKSGNPFLKPQYTSDVKIVYILKHYLTSSFTYSYISNGFLSYRDTLNNSKTFETILNIQKKEVFNLTANSSYSPFNWLKTSFTISGFLHVIRGNLNNSYLNMQQKSWSISATNTIKISKSYNLELFSFYNSRYLDAPAVIRGQWSVDVGAERKILNNKASVRLAVTDIFNSWKFYLERNFGGLIYSNQGRWESRQLKFSFAYYFGNKDIKTGSNRSSGLDDENKRIK